MSFHKTAKFKKLNKQWAKKLAKSGFEDIEQDEFYLKSYSGKVSGHDTIRGEDENDEGLLTWDYALLDDVRTSAKAEYFRWARHMLNDFKFATKRERKIWEMHSEGMGVRQIAKQLKTYTRKIFDTIKQMKKRMRNGL